MEGKRAESGDGEGKVAWAGGRSLGSCHSRTGLIGDYMGTSPNSSVSVLTLATACDDRVNPASPPPLRSLRVVHLPGDAYVQSPSDYNISTPESSS